jgi:hypothetical protein
MFKNEKLKNPLETHLKEAILSRDEQLSAIVDAHGQAEAVIAQTHTSNFEDPEAIINLDTEEFNALLRSTPTSITSETRETTAAIESVLTSSCDQIISMLPDQDRAVWDRAQKLIDEGISFDVVNNVLGHGSSKHVVRAMRAALDKSIWDRAWDTTQQPDRNLEHTEAVLTWASSHKVRTAMKTALDTAVWDKVQGFVDQGIDAQTIKDFLGWASSREVIHAMELAQDKAVWERGIRHAGQGSQYVDGIFSWASDDRVRQVFNTRIKSFASSQESQRRQQEQRRTQERRRQQHRRRATEEDRQPPRVETPPSRPTREDPRKQERDQIIQRAVAADRSFRWLEREDPETIQRVINSVRQMRKQAEADGKTMPDKQVYVTYRRIVETDSKNEGIKRSFSILNALMGGKPGGKLPF